MIEDLKHIEKYILLDLLKNPTIWNTLDVNYYPPRVERLWTQIAEKQRLMIHVIHPCEPNESLYHPHPWPSAMHILKGKYEMGLGFKNKGILDQICKLELNNDNYYEMLSKKGWHYVRPIGEECYSIMLTDKPWDKDPEDEIPQPWGKLPELSEQRKKEILDIFKNFYINFK